MYLLCNFGSDVYYIKKYKHFIFTVALIFFKRIINPSPIIHNTQSLNTHNLIVRILILLCQNFLKTFLLNIYFLKEGGGVYLKNRCIYLFTRHSLMNSTNLLRI